MALTDLLKEANPLHDLDNKPSGDPGNDLIAYACGSLRSFVRGGIAGAALGATMAVLTDYPHHWYGGAYLGGACFALVDCLQFKVRYAMQVFKN